MNSFLISPTYFPLYIYSIFFRELGKKLTETDEYLRILLFDIGFNFIVDMNSNRLLLSPDMKTSLKYFF